MTIIAASTVARVEGVEIERGIGAKREVIVIEYSNQEKDTAVNINRIDHVMVIRTLVGRKKVLDLSRRGKTICLR